MRRGRFLHQGRARLLAASALALALACGACDPALDVGSDVLWSARFEGGTFDEWTLVSGGGAEAFPVNAAMTNRIEVSTEQAHHGSHAARLSIDASSAGMQQNALLSRAGELPVAAYYSAWYYVPNRVTVGTFWVIFKFRQRSVETDGATAGELFDLDLVDSPSGGMAVVFYDHRLGRNVPLDVADAVAPIGVWFHVEAFYRNTQDATGRLTYWLDGRQIMDLTGQAMAPNPWIEWDPCNIGETLAPSPAVLFIDDCAVSRTRVGPDGLIAR
ncbi:MAG TPA: hypothetical protein VFH68_26365 [Polyangia bacterium]|jgi:hypothetical protein|nr:hypothetical protein [Polyangia bacterium]